MRIDVPEDLTRVTMLELNALERDLDEQRIAVLRAMYDRERSGAEAAERERIAAMPAWAQKLSTRLHVYNGKKFNRLAWVGAIAFVLICSGPGLLSSCNHARATMQRAQKALDAQPIAPPVEATP